jgi:hypothetical protein
VTPAGHRSEREADRAARQAVRQTGRGPVRTRADGGRLNNADKPGTMVFEYAGGQEFKDVLTQETKHTEKQLGGRHLRKDSPARLFKDRDFVASVGRFTAIDLFTGNYDRLLRYNPGNFKVDRINQTILLIDNVQQSNEFAFKTFRNLKITLTSDAAYGAWSGRKETQRLRDGQFGKIADHLIDGIKSGIVNWEQVRAKDVQAVTEALDESKGWWVQGLEEGRAWL